MYKIISKTIIAACVMMLTQANFAQVGINTTTPDGSAALEIASTDSGVLIPRMTQAERDLIGTPAIGLLIFQTDNTSGFYYYNGTLWLPVGGADTDWTVSGNDMYNANTGNVGVGNTTPTAKFHITDTTIPGNAGGLTTLYSNDFSSGSVTSIAAGGNTCVGGTSIWHISANSPSASCTPCSNSRAYILYSGTCRQDQTLIEGNFTPTTTSIDISFNYGYNDFGLSGTDRFTVTLYNETTASVVTTLVGPLTNDTFNATHNSTQTVVAGNDYSLRFRYEGDDDLAATVDDILVQETSVTVVGSYAFRLQDGQEQDGYVLTSDANGNATWMPSNSSSGSGSGTGNDWGITGNAGTDGGTPTAGGANFIGTTDNQNVDFKTNNIYRGRFSTLGEFFIGTYNTVIPGDLMNTVSNAAFPWAINGYSTEDGGGVYGGIQGGNTIFAAVQGEYDGTHHSGPGVRGLLLGTSTNASGYGGMSSAVNGQLGNDADYTAAIYGQTTGNTRRRVAGVLGSHSTNNQWGALGYERSNGNNHAVYGSGGYNNGGGRMSNDATNTSIGFGFDGGFLGGFAQGNQYGIIAKGDRFGLYADGLMVTNKVYTMVNEGHNGNKVANYASSSTTADITSKGVGTLVNGVAQINFDRNFSSLAASDKPIIVTVTPMGETKGVYTTTITKNGFAVKENLSGTSNVSFSWIAVAEKTGYVGHSLPKEVTNRNFNNNLAKVFQSESDNTKEPEALWWNGTSLEFGKNAPMLNTKSNAKLQMRPRGAKSEIDANTTTTPSKWSE